VIAHALRDAGLRLTVDSQAGQAGSRPDRRRALQLALAGIWLLDAALQYQPVMFTRAFGQTLAASAMGNPAVVADPISWNAGLVQHAVLLNAVFATVQLLLAAGIAWPRTARIALGASIAWALGVWWLGEGLGGMLAGTASPVTGAPGAAFLYALLAVLLWPADRARGPAPFTAARAVGARTARALWGALWLVLASVALWPQSRAPQAVAILFLNAGNGEPGWLAGLDRHVAVLAAQRGLAVSVVLAAVLALIGVAVWLPRPALRSALVLATALAAVIWVVGEAFGGILTGQGTDPNSGPLLALLALAYWPSRPLGAAAPASDRRSAALLEGADLGP
jgi:hypothetical protein